MITALCCSADMHAHSEETNEGGGSLLYDLLYRAVMMEGSYFKTQEVSSGNQEAVSALSLFYLYLALSNLNSFRHSILTAP